MSKRWGAGAAIVAVGLLTGCGGGSNESGESPNSSSSPSSASTSTSTAPMTRPSTTETTTPAASCPTPGFPPKATEPTGISGTDDAAAAKNIDNFKSFRLTMDSVIPKSHCMSDANLLGVAVWVCTKRAGGTSELDVAFQIPTVVQRLDKTQPAWDNSDSLAAVDKSETIYCPQYSPVG